jgi:hypothetical protein
MPKKRGLLIICVILSFLFLIGCQQKQDLENSKKNSSYSTPEEALRNVKNPKLEVLEIIDTKLYEDVSYVFFYSEVGKPKNYLAAGRINKNKYGWRFDEIIGVGNIDKGNAGMLSSKDEYIVGFASKEVEKVEFGNNYADIIELENKDIKAWLFHDLESDFLEQNDFDIKYYDKKGNDLPY